MFRESLRGPNANRRRCAKGLLPPWTFREGWCVGHGPSPVSPIVSGKHRSSVEESWAEIKDTLYRRRACNRFALRGFVEIIRIRSRNIREGKKGKLRFDRGTFFLDRFHRNFSLLKYSRNFYMDLFSRQKCVRCSIRFIWMEKFERGLYESG